MNKSSNKPDKLKILTEVNNSYSNDLLKLFDNNYDEKANNLYNRNVFFIDVQCKFIVERFKIKDKKFFEFLNISKKLLNLMKINYGSGQIWNLQVSKLKETGEILPHIDVGLEFEVSHRIHIPLLTNKNINFQIENEGFYLKKNNVYEINNLKLHSVQNNNKFSFNRIHLIIDYMPNEYISHIKIKEKNFQYS